MTFYEKLLTLLRVSTTLFLLVILFDIAALITFNSEVNKKSLHYLDNQIDVLRFSISKNGLDNKGDMRDAMDVGYEKFKLDYEDSLARLRKNLKILKIFTPLPTRL